jgi:Fic family protein
MFAAMVRRFIWEHPKWPDLHVDREAIGEPLLAAAFARGRVAGALGHLGGSDRLAIQADAFTETAVDTSAIEGEEVNRDSVRASLARRLHLPPPDRSSGDDPRADGIASVTVDVTHNAERPLTEERLCRWQSLLFPDPPRSLTVGAWRTAADDPMRVVSGPEGAQKIHYEAPPAARIPHEMESFLAWAESKHEMPPLVVAGLAHLRFETIHPFADGNGRIGRAIADLLLARGEPETAPYISLSRQILRDKTAYYTALELAQHGSLDVSRWVVWFIDTYRSATETTLQAVAGLQRASAFWREHTDVDFNARQRRVLERYLSGGFEGWINSRKYAAIAKTSTDTAARDLAELVGKGVIIPNEGHGRKTSYRLAGEHDPHWRTETDA